MLYFLLGLILLIGGYFTYGKFVESIIAPDHRDTPAKTCADGVDFVVMPQWKNMLIQLLNIAGVGPVIGVILGIKFGAIVFLLIPIGNIIGGAVHDYIAGMMSMRYNGSNLPALIQKCTGKTFYRCFSGFMIFLLLLVVAVFINIPAKLCDGFFPKSDYFWFIVALIFVYYIVATLFPVDKIIGKVYPIFGALLIIGSLAIFVVLMWHGFQNPNLLVESDAFKAQMFTAENNNPILPMLFVTIACGILSGFHATQSPIVARTMESEKQGRATFYGMMILEGIIGMIWAAAGLAIYNLHPEFMAKAPALVLSDITTHFLGSGVGEMTVISVIVLAITSGDTALRSLRLSCAEIFKIPQKQFLNRIFLTLPLTVIVAGLLWWSNQDAKSFNHLWNYFAWGNQVLASSTLIAVSVWLFSLKKNGWVTLIPGMFMTFVVLTYILWISPAHGGPLGLGLDLHYAYILSAFLAIMAGVWVTHKGKKLEGFI